MKAWVNSFLRPEHWARVILSLKIGVKGTVKIWKEGCLINRMGFSVDECGSWVYGAIGKS
ncbi:hypothetical protein [Yeosuana marina]|uniref:hypothetical protein n=1 Tax=Yeosuana marina TaxID=1565536 RepID=UPI0030C7C00B